MIEAFFSHLNADSNVTTLVNGIFPFVIPHGTDAPAVTYRAQGDGRHLPHRHHGRRLLRDDVCGGEKHC